MAKMKSFYPKTAAQALKWIRDNEHFEGYAATRNEQQGLVLRNESNDCFIPQGLLPEGAMQPSDYGATKRMFEPTEIGLALIAA